MEREIQVSDLLRQHDLKKTPARLTVLRLLSQSGFAVGFAELEQALGELADKVTLYRLLKSFEDKGIIHKTIDPEGFPKYALCQDDCGTHRHVDRHIHFSCTQCKKTSCLPHVSIPTVILPEGYLAEAFQFNISGICKSCALA
ncbi:MAG: transcriptional repressor [Bacteroidia bacterium]|nr:transcriptional repressor [Bacteroidia bacterium]